MPEPEFISQWDLINQYSEIQKMHRMFIKKTFLFL